MTGYDVIVIGGGLVGSAIAYGVPAEACGRRSLDEGDVAYRASRGNFGLVWVQSKGDGAPHYQRWTRRSADEWPALAAELAVTGIGSGTSGRAACISVSAMPNSRSATRGWSGCGASRQFRLRLPHAGPQELAEMLPGLGPTVTGFLYSL